LARVCGTSSAPNIPSATKPSRAFLIRSLKVTGARIDFTDNSRGKPFRTVVDLVRFSLTAFRTAGDCAAPCHFEAVTESGEHLAWTGTLSVDPLCFRGDFSVENLDLPKYTPYIDQALNADIAAGKLTVRGHCEERFDPGKRVLSLTDGGLDLRDLRIVERGTGRQAIQLSTLEATGIAVDAVAKRIRIGRVTLGAGHLVFRREKDGTINLLALLRAGGRATGAEPAPATAVPPVDLTVGEVALRGFQVDFTDGGAPRPVQLGINDLQCSVKNVTLAEGAMMPVQISLSLASQGTVRVEGSVSVKPALKLALRMEVAGLSIPPLSAYLDQFTNARITEGAASTSSRVQLAFDGPRPAGTFEGDVRVDKFRLVDGASLEDMAGFSALVLRGIKISIAPQLNIVLADVTVAGPYGRAVVDKDKNLNLAAVVKKSAGASAGANNSARPSLPRIEVGKVTIADGVFTFIDRSLEPNVKMVVDQLGGTIAGLSSGDPRRAELDLKATIDRVGSLAVAGRLDPLNKDKFADFTVDIKSVDLQPLSPYIGRFAGYELVRGKLSLASRARIAARKIDMSNVITLEQFTFGNPVKSPDATGRPVRFWVELLKDGDGRIIMDIPVEGSLDDPNLRKGNVVARAIWSYLTKEVALPFTLLGSNFGGGGEDLAYQDFAPGSSALRPEDDGKLQTLVRALTNRPGLSLDLQGSYDAAADSVVLKQQKFAGLVLRKIWEARRATDPIVPPPEKPAVTPEERLAMVKALFDEKFPPGTEFGAPLPPLPAPPPATPPPGSLTRVASLIPFEAMQNQRAAEQTTREASNWETIAARAPGLPVDVMTARLVDAMEVGSADLCALAAQRAERVQSYLLAAGRIAPERLSVIAIPAEATEQSRGPRVFLSLR
jgi:hypothetical protein